MRFEVSKYTPNELSGAALHASRQVWLASLGAAVIGREWIQAEAGNTFRGLVKQGTVVESRAIRFLGNRLEGGMMRANAVWHYTRKSVESTVRQAADTAVSLVKETLPRSLPRLELTAKAPAKSERAPAKRAAKSPAKRAAKSPAKRARRTVAKKAARKRTSA